MSTARGPQAELTELRSQAFTEGEAEVVTSLLRPLSDGLRRSTLMTGDLLVEATEDAPAGVLILDANNAIVWCERRCSATRLRPSPSRSSRPVLWTWHRWSRPRST